MAFEFKLPDIGEGVAEAEIVKWLVRVGDRVNEDQPLVEVLTDKATVEIPSPKTGRVARLGADEGQLLPVGGVLVEIEVDGAGAVATVATAPSAASPSAASSAAQAPAARVEAVPAARQLAKERGLDLAAVTGSGPGGRITLEDVKRALDVPAPVAAATPGDPAAPPASAADEERIPLRGLRRKIAEQMTRAAHTIPHFTFVAECDMTRVVEARRAAGEAARREGAKLTYLPYILRALAPALARYRQLNARFDGEAQEIVLERGIHIGMATSTDDGLIVPVIHDADRRGLLDLAREVERLAIGARAKSLGLEDLTGGTFTVTTTGALGGLLATPIIYAPQVAILGVHEVKPKAVVRDGQIVAREMTNLSLSLDHRVVDGQLASEFLYDVIRNLEDPSRVPLDEREAR